MKHEKFQMPDPFEPYGSNPVTIESINVRERHALSDEAARYHAAYNAIRAEHDNAVALIKAAFQKDRDDLIAANFAKREAA